MALTPTNPSRGSTRQLEGAEGGAVSSPGGFRGPRAAAGLPGAPSVTSSGQREGCAREPQSREPAGCLLSSGSQRPALARPPPHWAGGTDGAWRRGVWVSWVRPWCPARREMLQAEQLQRNHVLQEGSAQARETTAAPWAHRGSPVPGVGGARCARGQPSQPAFGLEGGRVPSGCRAALPPRRTRPPVPCQL